MVVKVVLQLLKTLIKELGGTAIKNDYYDYFANDGFFWGQQFQEDAGQRIQSPR